MPTIGEGRGTRGPAEARFMFPVLRNACADAFPNATSTGWRHVLRSAGTASACDRSEQ